MIKYIKNQRGDLTIEVMIVLAIVVMIVLAILVMIPVLLFGSNDLYLDTTSKITDNLEIEQVEEPVNTEELKEFLKIIFISLGAVTVTGAIIFFTLHFHQRASEKKKRGPQNLNEVLTFMMRKKPKKLFTLLKGTVEEHEYQYAITKYQWLLTATASELDIKMNRKNKTVLHITYDKMTETFTRKNLKAHIFSDEKTVKQLDKLVAIMLSTEWQEHRSFHFVSESEDINQALPQTAITEEHTVITDPMFEIEAHLEDIMEDAETKETFRNVIENMHVLRDYQTELDIETKHIIDYSLTNDLNRLLSLYEELNEDQKEMMAEEIQKCLDLMNDKVNDIKAKLEEKKASEIKKVLHLFDKRYQA